MNDNPFQTNIKVSFNEKFHSFSINSTLIISSFTKMIFTHFQVNSMTHSLLYKKYKLMLDDDRPLYTILTKEKNPLMFLLKKNELQKININKNPFFNASIKTKIPERQFMSILTEFFKSKSLPFNAIISNKTLGSYDILFQNEKLSKDFQEYFKQYSKSSRNKEDKLPPLSSQSVKCFSKKILVKRGFNELEKKLIKNASFKYMNYEEKKRFEEILKKKNWLSKEGFLVSVGNYSIKERDISNYVTITPSEPPVNYKYRVINKKKWMNPKGFFCC